MIFYRPVALSKTTKTLSHFICLAVCRGCLKNEEGGVAMPSRVFTKQGIEKPEL